MGRKALRIESDTSLVLKAPQHYHAVVSCYSGLAEDGKTFNHHTSVTLVGNDMALIVSRAKALTGRSNTHIQSITQCADSPHLSEG